MKLEPHPFSALFPPISGDDFNALVADIKANGLLQPIVVYQGKILDGNNRYRAVCQGNNEGRYQIEEFNGTDAQAQAYVISANIHRRHLHPEDRRKIIEALLKADPSKSNRQIAEQAKVSHVTVGDVRTELESTGQIDQLDKTTGADGKTRKRKGGKSKGGKRQGTAKPEKVKLELLKPVDHKTATNAYHIFEEHLLDALQDVNDLSSFGHAEEYAQRTIEKLQEKINEMQPEEAEEEKEREPA